MKMNFFLVTKIAVRSTVELQDAASSERVMATMVKIRGYLKRGDWDSPWEPIPSSLRADKIDYEGICTHFRRNGIRYLLFELQEETEESNGKKV